jgi:hypothetical protein
MARVRVEGVRTDHTVGADQAEGKRPGLAVDVLVLGKAVVEHRNSGPPIAQGDHSAVGFAAVGAPAPLPVPETPVLKGKGGVGHRGVALEARPDQESQAMVPAVVHQSHADVQASVASVQ